MGELECTCIAVIKIIVIVVFAVFAFMVPRVIAIIVVVVIVVFNIVIVVSFVVMLGELNVVFFWIGEEDTNLVKRNWTCELYILIMKFACL